MGRLGQLHHAADQVEAVHLGHPQVGDDEIEPRDARELEAGGRGGRGLDGEPDVGQLLGEQVAHRRVILDDEHGSRALRRHLGPF